MNIAVYCGSTPGSDPAFVAAARALGEWMGKNGHTLIFGGSNTGLMGAVADGVLSVGGSVTGVVPNVPVIRARMHPKLTTVVLTETMASRKSRMIELADAFIALPGGVGTLDEITEILSLTSLSILHGPVLFYDIKDYYAPMKAVLANILEKDFGKPEYFSAVHFPRDLAAVSAALKDGSEGTGPADAPA